METYSPTTEDAVEPPRAEREDSPRPNGDRSEPSKPEQQPAEAEPVTPYDHLWFERRPLS